LKTAGIDRSGVELRLLRSLALLRNESPALRKDLGPVSRVAGGALCQFFNTD
jgi:hypothetical protein